MSGQTTSYSYFYRVYFLDKGDIITDNYSARDLLSSRAIDRRHKSGIKVPDFLDFPVNRNYLENVSRLGLVLHTTSRWMNTALFKSQEAFDIEELLSLPYVIGVKSVKTPGKKNSHNDKLELHIIQNELPVYNTPITMINANKMHPSGYDGKNILIAILDGGFLNTDMISSLNTLRSRKGIKKTYDFVNKNESVYNNSVHGTAVLSVLAGNIPGKIEGTAPGSDFLLIKTEDVESEFPCEEDFWAAGAEFADSTGADIISSSLGYYTFDDPSLNYKYSDLDGNTSFITRVADIAASKGILVVNSAGNERNTDWKSIIFPSDGNNVVAAGAVDGNGIISDFSSSGPSADGRIKPDNVTMGVSVPVQTTGNSVGRSNGTSFSCPILSGIAACLMQAVPGALSSDIIVVLQSSADRYNHPDSLYGYGIPDIGLALDKLQNKYTKIPDDGLLIYPNPTKGDFEIVFSVPPENIEIAIFTLNGKIVFRKKISGYAGRTLVITELENREQGVYFLRITTGSVIKVRKVIKIKSL
jgi:hypothetical protein